MEDKCCGTCLFYDGHRNKCKNLTGPRCGDDMDEMHTCPDWAGIDEEDAKQHSGLLDE